MSVTLLRPEWLLLLPVLAGLGWWLHGRAGRLGGWERVTDPALLSAMAALGQVQTGGHLRPILAALIAALAIAGPAQERRDAVSFRNLDGVIFVLDASPSLTESALWPQIVTMGRFGIASLGSRPGALVVFAGDAYVASDLTTDHRQLGQTLSLIDAQTVPDPGSRPQIGLELARRMLDEGDVIAGDVLLFSDGAGLGPGALAVAQDIAARGARLSVITPDTAEGGAGALAAAGQGRLFTLDQTDDIAAFLRDDARRRLESQSFPLLFWRDYGRYLLALALLPLLLLFRRTAT